MKSKARITLKSLTDLPGHALSLAVAVPRRAATVTRQALSAPTRLTRRQIREARRRSAAFVQSLTQRTFAPLRLAQPWTHGGLNE